MLSSHNPLVLGSNPSGPTNQHIEAPAVRGIGVAAPCGPTGQLKLFSQLFATKIPSSGFARVHNRWDSFC
jgi:hypothetical protein